MSEQSTRAARSPYRGILPFRYADRAFFFGREREIQELAAKILLYRLVVLFGDSGAGKSSLINAGIVPRLEREGFQPERLRIRPFVESPFLVERISSGRQDSRFLPSAFAQDEPSDSREIFCSLERFKQALSQAGKERPLVLILDQFEELFTLFDSSYRVLQGRILEAIAGAANQKDLAVKIVIGIREDFLGKLELIARDYPQVFDRRVRLGLLGAEAAKRAVVGPFEGSNEFPAAISAEAADAVIGEFARSAEFAGIHPTQLQIVCSRLWDRHAGEVPVIGPSHFLGMNGVKGILEGFLESTTSALSPSRQNLVYQVLGQMITASGTRDVVSDARLKAWRSRETAYGQEELDAILDFLEEKRLINRTTQHGMFYFEVSSEYLMTPIQKYNRERECRDAERKAAEAAAKEANEAGRARELEQARLLAAEQMRLADAERRRAEFEARAAKRLRRTSRILFAVLVFFVLAIVGFIDGRMRAQKAADRANLEAARANREAELARQRASDLEQAKIVAEENWKEAMAANMRLTEMRTTEFFQPPKKPIGVLKDDMLIKKNALSRNPMRLKEALDSHPSRIAFDVDMKEIRAGGDIGKLYRFELFPREETVEGGLQSLAMITMLMDDPSFKKSILAAGPETRFMCSYEGWGCLDSVVAVIEFRDPHRRAEVATIRMCDILSRKFGSMQKR